jgi:hypothetical protein
MLKRSQIALTLPETIDPRSLSYVCLDKTSLKGVAVLHTMQADTTGGASGLLRPVPLTPLRAKRCQFAQ